MSKRFMPTRRQSLTTLAALCGGLVACGFAPRRPIELRFQRIQLVGFKPRSAMATELRLALNASPTTLVVNTPEQAQVVLEALTDEVNKGVVASSSAGQVTELQLRARFSFSLRTNAGKELIAPTEISLKRDMSYTESAALGKEQEEALLWRSMQTDIAQQVMRRLAAVQHV
jgi:LPS-assembly lipoprotein